MLLRRFSSSVIKRLLCVGVFIAPPIREEDDGLELAPDVTFSFIRLI